MGELVAYHTFIRAKYYLCSGVARQFRGLVVDRYDSNRDGEREAPAVNVISRERECKIVLGALCAVVHVVDFSTSHLQETKRMPVVI